MEKTQERGQTMPKLQKIKQFSYFDRGELPLEIKRYVMKFSYRKLLNEYNQAEWLNKKDLKQEIYCAVLQTKLDSSFTFQQQMLYLLKSIFWKVNRYLQKQEEYAINVDLSRQVKYELFINESKQDSFIYETEKNEELLRILKITLEEATPREKAVAYGLYSDGTNVPKIAQQLNLSKQRVYELRNKFIKKVQNKLKRKY